MITIQQAIYGDKKGGHGLLNASETSNKIFQSLGGYTDPVDRPNGGILAEPMIRGMFADGYFLLIKNFPYTSSTSIRAGRFFAHALFLDQASFLKIRDITSLFRYFLLEMDANAEMLPIEHDVSGHLDSTMPATEKAFAATNALLVAKHWKNTIAWTNEEEYWNWISRIWSQLPNETKIDLCLGAAFGPNHIKQERLNLVHIPPELKPSWAPHSFRVIDENTVEKPEKEVTKWLLKVAADSFDDLLADFDFEINSLLDLGRLEDEGKAYQRITRASLTDLLVFSYTVSSKSPSIRKGIEGKKKLLNSILKLIPSAQAEEMAALQYQTWLGIPGAIELVSKAFLKWLNGNLFTPSSKSSSTKVFKSFIAAESSGWWYTTIEQFLLSKVDNWQPNYAEVVWSWLLDAKSIDVLAKLLPQTAEGDFLQLAQKSKSTLGDELLSMCKSKEWHRLHAIIAGKELNAVDAISVQLRVDPKAQNVEALQLLANEIGQQTFIEISVEIADSRLFAACAQFISKKPMLKSHLDITSEAGQEIWSRSVSDGCPVWKGIKEPEKGLFTLLDLLLGGELVKDELLKLISNSESNSLRSYTKRTEVWDKLEGGTKFSFQLPTLLDCLVKGDSLSSLEIDLQKVLDNQEAITAILDNKGIAVETKLSLFKTSKSITEYYALKLIKVQTLEQKSATELGKLAYSRKWKEVAKYLFEKRTDNVLVHGLLECDGLLGFKKRLQLSLSGIRRGAITTDEWWQFCNETVVKLYPYGPSQNGIWINSGGNVDELPLQGSAKEIWVFSIQKIRNGCFPKITTLLDEMLKEFPNNDDLKKLKQTL